VLIDQQPFKCLRAVPVTMFVIGDIMRVLVAVGYRSNSSRRNDRHYRSYSQDQGEQGGYALNKKPCAGFPYTAYTYDLSL